MVLEINFYNIIKCDAVVGCGKVLGEGDFTIVIENVRFHHTAVNNMDHFFYDVEFHPRYSPFLNPCEEAFRMECHKEQMVSAEDDGFCVGIPVNSLSNFVDHAEIFSNKCLNLENIPRD
ncbi:hypothetical protein RF11_13823 [Thelohanellus kitauei]|uniref:Tc1-like transposase DDE domain-containing protein n=1 Tax=Thelohanellus kitauei TaxID=669202 RepID=A0A0C2J064_THEKT|nr:hypothetical protein RF11_13823 [Thelohanellus kitauei]